MIKKLNDLSREEKIMLLQAVYMGEVDKDQLSEKTLFAFEYRDFFQGLMIKADNNVTVFCLGDAEKAMNSFT